MAKVLKRCDCPAWARCVHPWMVRYRTAGGRASKQREVTFGRDRRAADDFALKIEHDRRARTFIDPRDGDITFGEYAQRCLDQHHAAASTIVTYQSVLKVHILPAIGHLPLNRIRREEIKALIAGMRRRVGASRIRTAHLVIALVLGEAVRDRRLIESSCVDIPLPEPQHKADFVLPTADQLQTLRDGLPSDWAATIELMLGCGLRIGEALAVHTRCRIADGSVLRVTEQVSTLAQLGPLKFRKPGDYRDMPLPAYVSAALDRHLTDHATTPDGYLFAGRRHRLVTRRTYQEDFDRAATRAGLPPSFTPHSLRHCFASMALAGGIPITDLSRWLGHRSIETTHRIYGHLLPGSWHRGRNALDTAYTNLAAH